MTPRDRRRLVPLAAVVIAASTLGACGSSSSQTSSGITVLEGSVIISPHHVFPLSMTTMAPGTLTVQLNLPPDIMVAGIATSGCTVAASQNFNCTFLDYSQAPTTSPSKTLTVPDAAAGNYVLIFANLGAGNQSVTYQVTLTSS